VIVHKKRARRAFFPSPKRSLLSESSTHARSPLKLPEVNVSYLSLSLDGVSALGEVNVALLGLLKDAGLVLG
jgi:hypothetical protein